ncbi:BREX system P-loop protein BrxC [Aeromonas hydrophila]|uniref:BREX system P-loop protein BrxC n=1 Tax=Aeromonas hydrophila TaxID=644 RepID=UPI001F4BCEEE|nr:BREX system P-loop protein BrxC [Aeromonas hydrophila]MCO4198691.1 BREX system P-loop protein BrxC [Aeromonas hydrophila]UNB60027.1 BREX system P-loop protein BrxC [Aeromonas hydrophila]
MTIKQLFDPSKNINRSIEKVITYGVSQEARLKSEISEYVVTDSIDQQFENLLLKMEAAMDIGGENEVGVWVSGFYGSGKSSFTKYLGLAFDDRITIDGVPFIQHLQDRLKRQQTKSLLSNVAKRFPAAVLMLDLASEQVAGATMEEVSTVLFYKVLQWAGYSRNLKVAALERRFKKEGRYNEFLDAFKEAAGGEDWNNYRNDELVVDSLIPEIAHKLYPTLFKTPSSFTTESSEIVVFENDRVREMLEIAREASGKEYIIFIIDEVGQYVGPRPNLILNLDGLAKNLKSIGDGKVWIVGTAQQTLTADDAKAALNSPELFKLNDRFPIQIELKSNDIKEICYTRLLGKSSAAEAELGGLFDQYGQQLRQNTKLVDARVYGVDFDRETFVNLYPFLPAHFDILLHLLGALAKSTGGIGLRSAIKVVQDILIDGSEGKPAVAEQAVGWLVTTVTLFDALEKDIKRAFTSLHASVEKATKTRFSHSELHQNIAKTVAVLQILGNLPITRQNVTSLMHASIAGAPQTDAVANAVEELINDPIVPFGEQDGNLCFFSEKLNNIELERSQVALRGVELRRIMNEALTSVYAPLPATQLHGSYAVSTGLKAQSAGNVPASLAGDRNPIQTIVELVDPKEIDNTRTRLTDESRQNSAKFNIYLVGRTTPEMDELTADIHRCREIANRYRSDPDQEIREYCNGQADRAEHLSTKLRAQVQRSLLQGSFIFRGQIVAVDTLSTEVLDAARKHLGEVAEQVFNRYAEAPVRVVTDLAEKFLRVGSLSGITNALDPLNLVQSQSGRHSIRTDHLAMVSIRDYIDRNGTVEGKRLTDVFADAPFGWSADTLRYLVAAMLLAGEIKLKVAGREVTVNGQQAIDAIKTNNTFKSIGISLRGGDRPSNDVLARAATRLTELTGDTVVPLEDDISKVTTKLFPQLQHQYGPLTEKLRSLNLPGVDRLQNLTHEINDVLLTDASDAPRRLGNEQSELFESLKWAAEVKLKLEQGLEQTLRDLRQHCSAIANLPNVALLVTLKEELAEALSLIEERLQQADFYRFAADFSTSLTTIRARIRDTVIAMQDLLKTRIKEAEVDLKRVPEWIKLTQQEQTALLGSLERLIVDVPPDLAGLTTMLNKDYELQSQVQSLKHRIERLGQQRIKEEFEAETPQPEAASEPKPIVQRQFKAKTKITSLNDLDELITQLQQLRGELRYAHEFALKLELQDEGDA